MQNATGNNNTHNNASDVAYETLLRVFVPISFIITLIVGLIGNSLVIFVIATNKQMRNTTNLLILNLSLADLIFLIFCIPANMVSVYILHEWVAGTFMCRLHLAFQFITVYISIYTLVLMSFDRYLAVVHAISSMRFRTTKNAVIFIVTLWVVVVGSNAPSWNDFNFVPYNHSGENRSMCIHMVLYDKGMTIRIIKKRIFYTCFCVFGFCLPVLLICVLYGLMLRRLLFGAVPGGNQSREALRSKRRVTRMIIIVIVCFIFCWLPIQLVFTTRAWDAFPENMEWHLVHVAAAILAYGNSCINPVLYAFLSENFRKSFRQVLSCGRLRLTRMTDYERTNIRGMEVRPSATTNLLRNGERVPVEEEKQNLNEEEDL
ncbi:unnamed protein product [Dimorphilus gyrociliatus]|uniref:G-protein coupled receptors family 1 profile domain-containing protein n=1 Tax=Dimorphilus gyrociliatus TaxID=2664684 RepID=A0A7I8WCE1_9ANNE|nr:unnamed protein product [Dimorphilus gyrociliatus]